MRNYETSVSVNEVQAIARGIRAATDMLFRRKSNSR
jgi:hypothetical protein